ncbi:MAG: DUF881 domain-containing protein [Bacillus sp. (in: firmicutes)]
MAWKNKRGFIFVSTIIGFMLAIQFQVIKEPEARDTRDTWQLKSDLLNEQKLHVQLTKNITQLEQQLALYETERKTSREQALESAVAELKEEAGLTEMEGEGVIITIEAISDESLLMEPADSISPDLLKRLINELNRYDAEHISINGQRVINTTVIRDINGVTKIDGYALDTFPIEIKVITEDAELLRDRLKVAQAIEEFFIENLSLNISRPLSTVTVPAYSSSITIKQMEPVK